MATHRVRFEPGGSECRVVEGTSLFHAALEAGLRLQTLCGGEGKCGRCKVRILDGRVRPTPHPFLSKEEIEAGFCLACLTAVEDDLEVLIPAEMELRPVSVPQALVSTEEIRAAAEALGEGEPEPWARWVAINLSLEAAADAGSEAEAVERALRAGGVRGRVLIPVSVMKKVARAAPRREAEAAFLVVEDREASRVLDVSLQPGGEGNLGVAIDLGTTVMAGALVDLARGEIMAERSAENLQAAHGADIIHRITFAAHRGGLERLQHLAAETVEGIVDGLLSDGGHARRSVSALAAAGNTTMTHLFLGLDPTYIRESPFAPVARAPGTVDAASVGIGVHPAASLWVSPAVANYLGGDITAGVLLTEMWNLEPLTLYLDLGTNGEIVLGNREWMAGCACSCGPAFEGSGVGCGMRATDGAVERWTVERATGEVSWRVIGEEKPRGICGSGLVDLIAGLRRAGFVDPKGRFTSDRPERFSAVGGRRAFVVVPGSETAHGEDIVITERDLEHLIRTKGAAFAGVRTLLTNLDVAPDRIERVMIAGGFGRSLDVGHAIEIGMIPDLPRDRFSYVGNGSLKGAVMALFWRGLRERIEEIARRITYVDLSTSPGYMEEFVASLFLPHTDLELFPSVR